MVIVDSDLIIKFLRGKDSHAIKFLKNLFQKHQILKTTIFNYCELLEGAYLSYNVPKNLRYIHKFLQKFEILQFNSDDAEVFSQIHAELLKKGTPIGDFDTLIAAMVISRNEIFITRNKRHFDKIPLLSWQNWDDKKIE